jgi:glutathione S-transferase
MRFHSNPLSQHSRRVVMAILELGLDVEIKVVDFTKGEHKSPAYLAHNPNGKVPVLEDGDFWLWESNAIMAYLADKKPGQSLYPTDAKQRADVHRWLFWESAHWNPACAHLTFERVLKPAFYKQQPDPVLVKLGETNLARYGAVLDGQLAGKEYVTGRLSLADLSIGSMLMYAKAAQFDLAAFPNVTAWLARLEARDSWKKTLPPF